MTLRNLYYNYTGYPNVYEDGGFGNFFKGIGNWVRHPFDKTARYNASVQSNPNSYGSGEITNFNTTGNGTTDWGNMGGFATGQTSQNNITNPYQGTTMMEQGFAQTGTPTAETVDGNAFADISKSGKSEGTFTRGGGGVPWGAIIGAAGTNIANAFLDTEASTADRVAGALGIPALANQWRADTSKGDAYIKDMQNSMDLNPKNYIQDASSSWGGANAVKQNLKTNISPISFNSAVPSLKDFEGNWWKNMGASVAQGAASGSVGGPWGALGGAVTGLFGSIGGLLGRGKRAERAYNDFLAKRRTLMSAQQSAFDKAVKDQTLSNMQALANGNTQQRINDMANIRAYGGGLIDPNPPFDDWYKTVPSDRNDTTSYNLRRAYELAPKEDLENWRTATPDELISGEKHLNSVYYNEDTGEYEFMKSKNHPTLKYELDWYYGDTPEATDFREKYNLDKSGEYYKYIPNNIKAYGGNLYSDGGSIIDPDPETVTAEDIEKAKLDAYYPNRLSDTFLGQPVGYLSEDAGLESYAPIIGTVQDWDKFAAEPTVGNAIWAGLSTIGDIPWLKIGGVGLRALKRGWDAYNTYRKVAKALDKTKAVGTAGEAADAVRNLKKIMPDPEYTQMRRQIIAPTRDKDIIEGVTDYYKHEGAKLASQLGKQFKKPATYADFAINFAQNQIGGGDNFMSDDKKVLSNNGVVFSYNPSSRTWISDNKGSDGQRIVVPAEEMQQNLQNGLGKVIDNNTEYAMGGNLYTDLSPNMMNLWNNKQQIDQQKVNMQQMNFGLGNSFNQKINRFDGGGWFDLLFGNGAMQAPTPAQGVTESSYTPAAPYSTLSELRRRSYLSQQAVENARRSREADIEFWDRYRNDWGDRTPEYANMSEEEFLQESEGLHDNPNMIGLPLSEYNRYKYRKYLNYPNNKTFGNAYLFRPSIDELRKKYPLEDLPVYKKGNSWYLKEGVPARNGYKNLESGGHKIRPEDFQDTIDDLRRRAWDNEFYDYRYDSGDDLPNPIKFEGNPNLYYKENGKYINDNGEEWSAGDFNDIRRMLKDGQATDPNKEGPKLSKRDAYLKYKKEQEERAKKREEEGHVNDYWHKDIDDNFMSNPIVEHDEIVVKGDKSKKSDNAEYRPTQRQVGYKKLSEDLGGSEGVKHFQEQYNAYHPESRIKVDGKVGDETVRAFQSWNNEYGSDNVYGLNKLDVDGIYGEKSQEFMSSGIAKRNLEFAYGGNLFANGGQVNSYDLPDNAQYYANGGTHEENPYGGIQVGVDQQGNPNLVEEGEFRWGDYIFSDRINVDPTLLSRYNLAPATKHQGKKSNKGKLSYADMAKKYAKKNGELANDPIGKNTLEAYMKRLQDAQEDQKFQDSMEQQKQDAINQYRNALSTPQQGNPMYDAMKYNGMGNAATQQGVNAGMSDLGQQGGGNEVLSNTNRSGNNMLHAFGGNLYPIGGWLGRLFGRTQRNQPISNPYGQDYQPDLSDWKSAYYNNYNNTYSNNLNAPSYSDEVNDYFNRIYSGNVGYGSPKVNTTVAPTRTPQNFQEWALWQHDNGNKPYVGSVNTGVEPDAFALQAQGRTANGSTTNADYTTGYNGATNTNTGSSGLTGNINTDNTTTGTYTTNAFKEDREGVPLYSTAGKFATFGKGLTPMLYDWMNKTNTKYDPNQRPANELVDMGNNSTFLRTADTIGGYRAPNLMDAERMNNAAQAQGLAALQAALSVGNGNRAFAANQIQQQGYNTGMATGNNYATTQQANNEERHKTDAFNTAIDQFNANARNTSYQDNQKAEQVGQQMALSAKQAANDYLQKENWYADRTNRTAMDNRATNQAAWTDNALNYFITQAQENAERNRQNNDITKRYWSDKDGVMHYIGDSGLNGKIREYFRKNNIDNGTFTGDRLAAFNSIIQNNKAKDVANEKGELWSTVQGLMDDEIAARNKETADADKAKADELQEYRDQFDSELAQLGRYAANKDIYGNYWTSSRDLDYYGKEGFRDSQSLSQLKRAIEMLRTHNDRYNKWTPQNVTAYGGRINNGNKSNKNGYYTYTY